MYVQQKRTLRLQIDKKKENCEIERRKEMKMIKKH
jgi:hypothetical protein